MRRGGLATLPALILLAAYFGRAAGIGGVITLWLIGLVWILKRRDEDPSGIGEFRGEKDTSYGVPSALGECAQCGN